MYKNEYGRDDIIDFSCDALATMTLYPWPGNVRELEKSVARAVVVAESHEIQTGDLLLNEKQISIINSKVKEQEDNLKIAFEAIAKQIVRNDSFTLGTVENRVTELVIQKNGKNLKKSAEELGISYSTIRRDQKSKLKPHN